MEVSYLSTDRGEFVYLTGSWTSGTSGYRKWSDGFIEQWGSSDTLATVTLPTSFSNTNYGVIGTRTATKGNEVSLCFYDKTTTSFYANSVWVGGGAIITSMNWFAYGY